MKQRFIPHFIIMLSVLLLTACSQKMFFDGIEETPSGTYEPLETAIPIKTSNNDGSQIVKELKSIGDFNNDGVNETVRIVDFNGQYFELQICEPVEKILWKTKATSAHIGWLSVFLCQLEGNDYLLVYTPYSSEGSFQYEYNLFSLDSSGNELLIESDSVEFDTNFNSSEHEAFNPDEIADFMIKVNDYLETSKVLLNTNQNINIENEIISMNKLWWIDNTDGFTYDPDDSLEKILEDYKEFHKKNK